MTRKFALLLTLISVLILSLSLTGGGTAGAAVPASAGARWEVSITLPPESAKPDMLDRNAWVEQMRMDGISAGISDGRLAMSGQKDMDQLRVALFDSASQWMDFLGGAVEMSIYLPAAGEPITLNLEARNTSGAVWQVLGGDYRLEGESTFAMRYRGMGVPSIQTMRLISNQPGGSTIQLVYQRPWEARAEPRARVSIWLRNPAASIELSDPTPAVINLNESSVNKQNDAYASLDEIKTALPSSWDWRTKGIVTDVRDQGDCGSCWAFGTVGVMESAVLKVGGPVTNLSEQFLISCNKDNWGCRGGLTATKYHYNVLGINQLGAGAVLESVKPYKATKGTCSVAYKHPYKAAGWQFVTGSEWTIPTNTQLKNAIYTYGPITAGVCADRGWTLYSSGVYVPLKNECNGSTNHQIVLVGWDDATSSWILRNSWGPSWGEAGYMRIRWDPMGKTSRVGEGTSWVIYADPTIPVLVSPKGNITDSTPTFKWKKVSKATEYRYQVYQGSTLLYTMSTDSTACGSTYCTGTPSTIFLPATYRWRAQAYVGGVWKTYSASMYFTVPAADGG